LCVFNLSSRPAMLDLDTGQSVQPVSGHGLSGIAEGGKVRLAGYGAWFGRPG
jgi:alpha-glucosidase